MPSLMTTEREDQETRPKQRATFGPPRGVSSPSPARFLRSRCGATAATSSSSSSSSSSSPSSQNKTRGGEEATAVPPPKKKPPVPSLDEAGAWRPQRRERDWVFENVAGAAAAAAASAATASSSKISKDLDERSSAFRHESFGAPPPYLSSIKEALAREKEERESSSSSSLSQKKKEDERNATSPLPAELRSAALEASLARLSAARAALAAAPLVYDTPSRARARAAAERAAREAEEDVKLLSGGRALAFFAE